MTCPVAHSAHTKARFTMAFDHLHEARDLGLPESSMFDTSDLCLGVRKYCKILMISGP